MKNRICFFLEISLACLTVIPYAVLLLFSDERCYALVKEDGVFETASALCWLISAMILFYLFFTDRRGNCLVVFKTRRNIFFLLLALMFFFGFGEEISWGQRIFGIATPEPLKEINEQGELNIHNLAGFQVERLFSLFWFAYAFAVPLTARLSGWVKPFLCKINLPLIPLWIGILFLINYLTSKLFQPHFSGATENFPIEAKEFGFALLFFIASISFLRMHAPRVGGD